MVKTTNGSAYSGEHEEERQRNSKNTVGLGPFIIWKPNSVRALISLQSRSVSGATCQNGANFQVL